MSSITVKEISSEGFVTINEDEMLSKALSIFREKKPHVIIVLNTRGKYRGILAERWIVRSRLNPDVTKVRKLIRYAPKLSLNSSLSSAAKLMIENDLRQLPVFDGESLVGAITDEDIIHQGMMEKFGDTKVEEVMSKDLFVVEDDASVGSVISLFRDQGFSRAPVVKDGKLVGIMTKRDLLEPIAQLERVERERLTVQFATKGAKMSRTQQDIIIQDFNSFAKRYEKTFKGGTLFVYMKMLGRRYKELPLVHCRLQLRTRKGLFVSVGEGWGIEQTFHLSLDRLERQVLRSKEMEYEPKFSRMFLEETAF